MPGVIRSARNAFALRTGYEPGPDGGFRETSVVMFAISWVCLSRYDQFVIIVVGTSRT